MESSVIRRIHTLQRMSVAQLRGEWEQLYGEPTRSRNRDYLWRRLAWRVQELAHGGLSEGARERLHSLAPAGFERASTPTQAAKTGDPEPLRPQPLSRRDPRLPSPGTVLTRQYHGREIRVVALDDGFEWEGRQFRSLSAVARAVTGQRWSGPLFFGLRSRSRKS